MSRPARAAPLVLATRRSQLALTQARGFAHQLQSYLPDLEIRELHVTTSGDRIQDRPLYEVGGKGLFVKEIEQALLDGRADFAVHSVKDIPASLADGLTIACLPRRADPRDALVSRDGHSLRALREGARVGSSSLRRAALLRLIRPDLQFEPLRGNVDTRIRKVREGLVDAAVLAVAGLERLGRMGEITEILDPAVCLPAVGQGALGIECRADAREIIDLVRCAHDPETAIAVAVERGVLLQVHGGCTVPVAAWATKTDPDRIRVRAMLANPETARVAFEDQSADWPSDETAAGKLGRRIGELLLGKLR